MKGSLERLQLEYVDIVLAGKFDPKTPVEGKEIVPGDGDDVDDDDDDGDDHDLFLHSFNLLIVNI